MYERKEKTKKVKFISDYFGESEDQYNKNEVVEANDLPEDAKDYTEEYDYQLIIGHWNLKTLDHLETNYDQVLEVLVSMVNGCDLFVFTEWIINLNTNRSKDAYNKKMLNDLAQRVRLTFKIIPCGKEEIVILFKPDLEYI